MSGRAKGAAPEPGSPSAFKKGNSKITQTTKIATLCPHALLMVKWLEAPSRGNSTTKDPLIACSHLLIASSTYNIYGSLLPFLFCCFFISFCVSWYHLSWQVHMWIDTQKGKRKIAEEMEKIKICLSQIEFLY